MRTTGEIENDVLFGHNGYLFLASGVHKVLETVTGELPISADSIANFAANIKSRAAWAAQHAKGFVHVINPDKQSIAPEEWPLQPPMIIAERFLAAAAESAEHIDFPLDALRAHKAASLTKIDTHMSDFGTLVTVCRLVERLTGASQASHFSRLTGRCTRIISKQGDLGSKVTPPIADDQPGFDDPMPGKRFSNLAVKRNNGLVDLRFNPEAPYRKRLMLIGDSFGREMCRFLPFFFSEVHFFRSPYFHPEIAAAVGADFIVTNCVERYLKSTRLDEERPFFFTYPHVGGEPYAISAEFAECLSAVMSYPRSPYVAFARKMGLVT